MQQRHEHLHELFAVRSDHGAQRAVELQIDRELLEPRVVAEDVQGALDRIIHVDERLVRPPSVG